MGKRFVRRSLLYVPGSSEKMVEKAIALGSAEPDSIIVDLEDAVSMAEKEGARDYVIRVLPKLRTTGREIVIRVNAMDTLFGIHDLLSVPRALPDTLILPKADVMSVRMADRILTNVESELGLRPGGIGLIPLLETAEGINLAEQIVRASSRINGVQLGAEDLTKELGIRRTPLGEEIRFARQTLVYAACAAKIDCLDTPFTGIRDLDGLREDSENAAAMGFTGKTCIHPSHIETIDRAFSPGEEEAEFSRRLVAAFEEAVAQGKGACMFEKKMIDQPVADRARKLIEKYDMIAAAVNRG